MDHSSDSIKSPWMFLYYRAARLQSLRVCDSKQSDHVRFRRWLPAQSTTAGPGSAIIAIPITCKLSMRSETTLADFTDFCLHKPQLDALPVTVLGFSSYCLLRMVRKDGKPSLCPFFQVLRRSASGH